MLEKAAIWFVVLSVSLIMVPSGFKSKYLTPLLLFGPDILYTILRRPLPGLDPRRCMV
jgi:hypothetical protein